MVHASREPLLSEVTGASRLHSPSSEHGAKFRCWTFPAGQASDRALLAVQSEPDLRKKGAGSLNRVYPGLATTRKRNKSAHWEENFAKLEAASERLRRRRQRGRRVEGTLAAEQEAEEGMSASFLGWRDAAEKLVDEADTQSPSGLDTTRIAQAFFRHKYSSETLSAPKHWKRLQKRPLAIGTPYTTGVRSPLL